MEKLTIDHQNGHKTDYQLIPDGTDLPIAYHAETPKQVIDVMERLRRNRTRVKLHYGDVNTGRDWNEENDVTGYISLSRGHKARFPILVYNERSMGGGSILDHRIVKIKGAGGHIYYQSENYIQPVIEIVPSDMQPEYKFNLNINGKLYSRHKTERQANLLKKKLS